MEDPQIRAALERCWTASAAGDRARNTHARRSLAVGSHKGQVVPQRQRPQVVGPEELKKIRVGALQVYAGVLRPGFPCGHPVYAPCRNAESLGPLWDAPLIPPGVLAGAPWEV
jgi:hypothetical protein